MAGEASLLASRQALPPAPEGFRQRQLDCLGSRGGFAQDSRIGASVRDIQDASEAPAAKVTPRAVQGMGNTRRHQDGKNQGKKTASQTMGAGGEVRIDITPDGGSAGREGRQFTVANVGNNGRIYLRYVRQGTLTGCCWNI